MELGLLMWFNTDIDVFFEQISSMVKTGKDNDTKPGIDIFKWLNFVTFDIVTDLAFGESFKTVATGKLGELR